MSHGHRSWTKLGSRSHPDKPFSESTGYRTKPHWCAGSPFLQASHLGDGRSADVDAVAGAAAARGASDDTRAAGKTKAEVEATRRQTNATTLLNPCAIMLLAAVFPGTTVSW